MIPFAYLSPGLGYLLWGGASLAVLVLAVWLLALPWYRRFRALALFFLGASALLLISTVLVGVDGMNGYVGALLLAGGSDRVGFQAIGSHTLAGLAYTVGTEASSGLSIWPYPV